MDPDANIEALHQRIRELEKEASQQKKTAQMLRKQNVYLTALHETTLGLIRRLDVTDVLKTIIRHTASLAGTQHSFLYLYDDKEDVLRLKIGRGMYQNQIGYVIRRGEGVAGRVFDTASSLVINDYRSWEGRHSNSIWKSVRAVAALPLKSGHQMVGVIGALYTQAGQKFEDEIKELTSTVQEQQSLLATLSLLETENRELRQALGWRDFQTDVYVIGKVVGKAINLPDTFAVINIGSKDGLKAGQAVIIKDNILIGKVFSVENESSIIQFISDNNSVFSVKKPTDTEPIGRILGRLGLTLSLDTVPATEELNRGDIIVTSGLDELIPANLVIGSIDNIEKDTQDFFQKASVRTPYSTQNISIVSVIIRS